MNSPITTSSATFLPAPIGTRIRVVSLIVFGALVVGVGVVGGVMAGRTDSRLSVLGAASALPLLAALWYCSRIRRYEVTAGQLQVVRPVFSVCLDLAGLTAVEVDPSAMGGAWKTIGNDGLGAISGRFRSRKLGAFRAYVSDPRCSVILRWSDRCVVISPAKPEPFAAWMRSQGIRPCDR